MYIQERSTENECTVPPDYSGHTYTARSPDTPTDDLPPTPPAPQVARSDTAVESEGEDVAQKSTQTGAFSGHGGNPFSPKEGKRGDPFGALGLSGLFSRIPFLSTLAPPARRCGEGDRKHGELWDWILLALVALSFLNGKDDDVLPLLLLLLLWD